MLREGTQRARQGFGPTPRVCVIRIKVFLNANNNATFVYVKFRLFES